MASSVQQSTSYDKSSSSQNFHKESKDLGCKKSTISIRRHLRRQCIRSKLEIKQHLNAIFSLNGYSSGKWFQNEKTRPPKDLKACMADTRCYQETRKLVLAVFFTVLSVLVTRLELKLAVFFPVASYSTCRVFLATRLSPPCFIPLRSVPFHLMFPSTLSTVHPWVSDCTNITVVNPCQLSTTATSALHNNCMHLSITFPHKMLCSYPWVYICHGHILALPYFFSGVLFALIIS